MKRTERFRTMEMTRRIRDQIYQETKNMSKEELLRFFNERGETGSSLEQHEPERRTA